MGSDRALEHVHGPVALQASLEGLQRLDGGGVLLSNEVKIKCFLLYSQCLVFQRLTGISHCEVHIYQSFRLDQYQAQRYANQLG